MPLSASLSWEEEQRRERLAAEADLYSIIFTVEALERAYVRDTISPKAYTNACRKLIGQLKTLEHIIGGLSVRDFIVRHELSCPAAQHRSSSVVMTRVTLRCQYIIRFEESHTHTHTHTHTHKRMADTSIRDIPMDRSRTLR
ncbi:hypothetical protein T492DRAFT_584 [Pavlovales sp. CCMP2436]|nr:hypothetical protein T492DRAFT_584 [Pavlovales sp. CCMP2436]